MSQTDKADKELSCSFCQERFCDVIKLIPECGNNICGRCDGNLKEDVEEASKKYECLACGERHTLPSNGLRENKPFLTLLSRIKSTEKLIHPNVKKLRDLVREVEEKMEKLRMLDQKELIKSYCEKIELEASEAIEKAINHLVDIEKKMMRQINEYRERCLENLSKKSSETENRTKQKLTELEKEVSEFNSRWNNYFTQIDANESEGDIEAALTQTAEYMSALDSVEERMKKKALNWEKMVFNVNSQFLEEWNHVGEIVIIAEPKMTIQETPSFTLTGHSNTVRQVLFLPNGRKASCSTDETIKIWNVENGKELFELKGHTGDVNSIVLLPNGHLASGSRDRTIKIWDLEQRKEIRSINAHSESVVSLRVLRIGNLASYSNDDTIKIWNLNSKVDKPVSTLRGHGNTFWLSQLFGILSGVFLVTCSRHKQNKKECILRVWNPNEPNHIKSVPTGLNDAESLLVLSNDQVALGFERSGTIKIMDLNYNTLTRTRKRAHDSQISSLAQLSNGILVSAGKDGSNVTIKVWNLYDWSLLQTINSGHSNWIYSLSISSDEKFLASGSIDNTIKLWPISSD